jgi:membrane-associated phospholipid phosphatase
VTRRFAVLIWLALFAGAFAADRTVAQHLATHPLFNKHDEWVALIKLGGNYWFTICVAALLLIFHEQRWRAAALPLIAGALGGLLYSLLKWIVGRHRPDKMIAPFAFHPFIGGLRGLWNEHDLGFPSGHATLAFATAASLAMLLPRRRPIWFVLAATVAAERVLENAHYLSDVVAGAGLGVCMALLSRWLMPSQNHERECVASAGNEEKSAGDRR